MEPDWATVVIDHPDLAAGFAYSRFNVEHTAPHATVGRALPRLLREAGLTLDTIIPATVVFTDATEAEQVLTIRAVTERAVAAGYLTGEQGRSWLDHLEADLFFAAITLFVVTAVRPECTSAPEPLTEALARFSARTDRLPRTKPGRRDRRAIPRRSPR